MGKNPADDVSAGEANAVQREIEVLRQRTEDLLSELERRMSDKVDRARAVATRATDGVERVKGGLARAKEFPRKHPRRAVGAGVATAVLIGLGVWWLWSRRAERQRLVNRARRRLVAYRALLADPERALASRGPSLARKLGLTLAVTAARQLLVRAMRTA